MQVDFKFSIGDRVKNVVTGMKGVVMGLFVDRDGIQQAQMRFANKNGCDTWEWYRESELKKLVIAGLLLIGLVVPGCAATYEKRFTDHDGHAVVITEQHDADWWNNFGTPDWMNVRHETITRDGKVVADRHCTHKPTAPTLLDCREK